MATFGKTVLGARTGVSFAGYKMALKFDLPEEGKVTSVTMYFGNTGFNARVAIYDGVTGILYAESNSEAINTIGFHQFNLPTPIILPPGQISLAWKNSADAIVSIDDTTTPRTARNTEVYNGFSNPFGTVETHVNVEVTIFATYTPTAAKMCPLAIIATSIYGPSVELSIIRKFRDNFMARTRSGRWLSRTYYRVGKYVARWLVNKEKIKAISKAYLNILVKLLKR